MSLTGYTPVYDLSGKPVVIVVPESVGDVFNRIEAYDPIKVVRGKAKNTGLLILKEQGRGRYKSSLPGRQQPADIRDWLLRLWGDGRVTEWAKTKAKAEPEPIPEPIPEPPTIEPPADDDEGRRKLAELMARLRTKATEPPTVGESLPAVKPRRRKKGE